MTLTCLKLSCSLSACRIGAYYRCAYHHHVLLPASYILPLLNKEVWLLVASICSDDRPALTLGMFMFMVGVMVAVAQRVLQPPWQRM